MRIGFGYDSHRFESGRRLVLGGVEFTGETGLAGHSDADALIHAVIDALLGAAALGDIGSHFPDTSGRWKDEDSTRLLAMVRTEIETAGYEIENIDATVICERPKIGPHVNDMRECLAKVLEIPVDSISIKGKTNERMDDVGSGLGIEAHAVCLLKNRGG